MNAKLIMKECRDDRERFLRVYLPVTWLREFDDALNPPIVAGEQLGYRWGSAEQDGYKRMTVGAYIPMSAGEEDAINRTIAEIQAAIRYLKERKMYGKRKIIIPLNSEQEIQSNTCALCGDIILPHPQWDKITLLNKRDEEIPVCNDCHKAVHALCNLNPN